MRLPPPLPVLDLHFFFLFCANAMLCLVCLLFLILFPPPGRPFSSCTGQALQECTHESGKLSYALGADGAVPSAGSQVPAFFSALAHVTQGDRAFLVRRDVEEHSKVFLEPVSQCLDIANFHLITARRF